MPTEQNKNRIIIGDHTDNTKGIFSVAPRAVEKFLK
jgi:hypothetical protein